MVIILGKEKLNNVAKVTKVEDLKVVIYDEKVKASNFQKIHDSYKNESEISFIDSLEKQVGEKSLKEFVEEKKETLELIMIHRESRKIYYLFIYDNETKESHFIMKNDSIMKNKIYSMKLSQLLDEEIKITYVKNDRKNQSREFIHHTDAKYQKNLEKYSMI